jgi:AraC-like DNA-binding protein
MKTKMRNPLALDDPRQRFDAVCRWIDDHLDESIGWQTLIENSGLDYQALQSMFFEYESTTAMMWIRQRREAIAPASLRRRPLSIAGRNKVH